MTHSRYQHIWKDPKFGLLEKSPELDSWEAALTYLEHNGHKWVQSGYEYMLTIVTNNTATSVENFDINLEAFKHQWEINRQNSSHFSGRQQVLARNK